MDICCDINTRCIGRNIIPVRNGGKGNSVFVAALAAVPFNFPGWDTRYTEAQTDTTGIIISPYRRARPKRGEFFSFS